MSTCCTLSDSEFNQAIVPLALQSLSQQDQCQQVISDENLRRQLISFYGSLTAGASFQRAPGKVGQNLWVPWSTGATQYIIPFDRQSSFYSYVLCGSGIKSGYGFLLKTALTYQQRQQTNSYIRSNGGLGCPGNPCSTNSC